MTPLHVAAERGHDRIVEYLIDLGAKINAEDNDGVGLFNHYCTIWVSNIIYNNCGMYKLELFTLLITTLFNNLPSIYTQTLL